MHHLNYRRWHDNSRVLHQIHHTVILVKNFNFENGNNKGGIQSHFFPQSHLLHIERSNLFFFLIQREREIRIQIFSLDVIRPKDRWRSNLVNLLKNWYSCHTTKWTILLTYWNRYYQLWPTLGWGHLVDGCIVLLVLLKAHSFTYSLSRARI